MSDLFKPAGRLVLQGDYENALGLVNTMMRIGDILVLSGRAELVHTAIYTGKGMWWHKPGAQAAEFATEERVVKMYNDYTTRVEYRRFTNTRMTRRKKLTPVPFVPAKEKFIYKMYRLFLDFAGLK